MSVFCIWELLNTELMLMKLFTLPYFWSIFVENHVKYNDGLSLGCVIVHGPTPGNPSDQQSFSRATSHSRMYRKGCCVWINIEGAAVLECCSLFILLVWWESCMWHPHCLPFGLMVYPKENSLYFRYLAWSFSIHTADSFHTHLWRLTTT